MCHTWLKALSHLPIATITFYRWDKSDWERNNLWAACQWIIANEPTVQEVYQDSQVELTMEAMRSLHCKVGCCCT